jgi:hypothetical protein
MSKRNISVLALTITLAIILFFYYLQKSMTAFSTGPFPMDWSINLPEDDTSLGGIFFSPEINDSLPHYFYKRTEDSLKKISSQKEIDNKSWTSGKSFGPIGAYFNNKLWGDLSDSIIQKDSLLKLMRDSMNQIGMKFIGQHNDDSLKKYGRESGDINWRYNVRLNKLIHEKQETGEKFFYLGLNGYDKDYQTKFFIQNGIFNLAYVKWDSVRKRSFDSTKTGHYEQKQIRVRYNENDKRILIPVTKNQYKFLNSALDILTLIWGFIFVYFFIGLPVQILINISKGNAFNVKNIIRLKTMAYIMFAYALLSTLAPFTLHLIFRKIIPDDFQQKSFSRILISNLYLFFIAIVIFIIRKAFNRGYKLQQEQDLTV